MRSIRILLFALLFACDATAAARQRTILVYGDSLSAAYGMRAEQGWVAQLQARLDAQGYGYQVVNASISGETTSGGLARLPRALKQHGPDLVILELGANDGLRGLPVAETKAGLAAMIKAIKASGAATLLVGILIPPNYGPQYTSSFAAMYTELAASHKLPLVPFLIDGVALDENYMQADGLHPNELGQPRVLENVWKHLQPMLRR